MESKTMTAFFVCKKNKEKEIENMLQNNEKTAEVIEHNRKMLVAEREAEQRQQSRSQKQRKNEQSL